MQSAQKQLFGEVVKRALVTPASLGLLTASCLVFVTPEMWSLALAGFLAELGLLQALVRNERFVRGVQEECQRLRCRQQAERVAQMQASVDRPTGELLGRIQVLQDRLLREWDAAGPPLHSGAPALLAGDSLGVSRQQVSGLLDQCLRLAQKRARLQTYLHETQPVDLQRHAVQLQEKWERCHDDVARQLYEHALRQKRSELENYAAIQQAVARIDGQLETIECSFGNLLGRVIRLKSADATHARIARDQLGRDLSELTAGINALEHAVNEALSA
jgi:hypothetical protein